MCRKILMKFVILKKTNALPHRKEQLTLYIVHNRERMVQKPPNKYHIKYRNYIEAKNTYMNELLTLR